MTVTGKLTKVAGQWSVKDLTTGKEYTLSGVEFPPRTEGLNVRIVGTTDGNFGGGIFDDAVTVSVQRWDVV